jgi:serine protease inhibitor
MVIHTTTVYADTAKAIADFSQQLIKKTPQGQSVWLSPVGIITALGMLLGATSQKDQLLETLGLSHLSERDIHHLCGSYVEKFNHNGQPTTSMKNEVIRDSISPMNQEFLDLMTDVYKASIRDTAPPGTASLIVTNGFTGRWKESFSPHNSEMLPFHLKNSRMFPFNLTPSRQISVAMMHQTMKRCRYLEKKGFQMLAIPYQSDDGRLCEQVFFLPSRWYSLSALEHKLTFSFIEQCLKKAIVTEVDVTLPMFDMQNTLALKEVLGQMGIPVEDKLTGMGENCFVEEITHEAFGIDNEKGSEAGSQIIIGCVLGSHTPTFKKPPSFFANRGYHKMIIAYYEDEDRSTPVILFRGRAADETPFLTELPLRN